MGHFRQCDCWGEGNKPIGPLIGFDDTVLGVAVSISETMGYEFSIASADERSW